MTTVSTNVPLKKFLKECEDAYWQDMLVRFPRRSDAIKFSGVKSATFYRRIGLSARKEWRRLSSELSDEQLNPVNPPPDRCGVMINRPKKSDRVAAVIKEHSQLCVALRFFGINVTRDELSAKSVAELEWIFGDARQTYLRLCKRHHPDTGGDVSMMSKINSAWARLRDLMMKRGVGAG